MSQSLTHDKLLSKLLKDDEKIIILDLLNENDFEKITRALLVGKNV